VKEHERDREFSRAINVPVRPETNLLKIKSMKLKNKKNKLNYSL